MLKTATHRHSQAEPAPVVKRFTAWGLVLALSVLHPLPGKTLYHCRVTGAKNLPECCCKGTSRCCEQGAASGLSCCETANTADRDGERRNDGHPFALASDSCGCCDVSYEQGTSPLSALSGKGDGLRRLSELSFLGLPLQTADFLPLRPRPESCINGLARAPPGNSRPLYILFSSLLF